MLLTTTATAGARPSTTTASGVTLRELRRRQRQRRTSEGGHERESVTAMPTRTRWTPWLLAVLVASLVVPTTSRVEPVYDNEITGEPEIECGYGVVNFRVHTAKQPASQVYVKGNSANPECVFRNTDDVKIDLSKCNVRRKREVNPTGVAYQMTVIVQLHPLFVTKVDRAYNVNCFYMEKKEDVAVEFGVSDIPTQLPVLADAQLPSCNYSVHRDSPNGPLVRYTKVGELLYHVWECPSKMYSMLLYNCRVVDGKGTEYSIIDTDGCSKDEYLMPQITYNEDLNKAMVASAAFNFPDRNTMFFSCKIKLCYHGDNCNAITPPKCGFASSKPVDPTRHSPNQDDSITEDLKQDELFTSTQHAFSEITTAETLPTLPSTTTTTAPTSRLTTIVLSTSTSSAFLRSSNDTPLPADFPRPEVLPQADDGSGEVDDEPVSVSSTTDSFPTPPLQIIKKADASAPSRTAAQRRSKSKSEAKATTAAGSNGTSTKSGRQQRDTDPAPKKTVDFDIASPELTIIDDYSEPSAAAQLQKQLLRDASTESASKRGICFSPTAVITAATLLTLVFVAVIFVLLKSRKTVHQFY